MKCQICGAPMHILYQDLFDDRYGAPGKYAIYRCSSCGFGRTTPALKKSEISKLYSEYYPLGQMTPSQVKKSVYLPSKFQGWMRGNHNTAHWQIAPGSSVLDIGSASGVSLLEIAKLGGIGYGVEPDPNAKKIAKALALKVFSGFIYDEPFPSLKFDYITASQVIEHEPNPKRFLKAAAARLKKEGRLILSFPNIASIYCTIFGKNWINWHVPYHINFFNKKSFSLLAEACDLKIMKIQTITPNLWTLLQLRMLLSQAEYNQPNSLWTNKPSTKKIPTPPNYFAKQVVELAPIGIAPLNRLIDLFGQGDSILVILKRKH